MDRKPAFLGHTRAHAWARGRGAVLGPVTSSLLGLCWPGPCSFLQGC